MPSALDNRKEKTRGCPSMKEMKYAHTLADQVFRAERLREDAMKRRRMERNIRSATVRDILIVSGPVV